jgi:RHH-type proline utilization regulon transcriptional repressor/proline dehydrogenase/delta 1-pyrroline-5-carboxylate dehydrogenase
MLYGMAEPFKRFWQMWDIACVIILQWDLIPGMAYLVRRLLENTANEGF